MFSYAHQDAQTQTSVFTLPVFLNELDFEYKLIPHLDNPQIAEDKTMERQTKPNTASPLGDTEVGFFEENIQVGKDNYTLAEDTKPIGANDKDRKYHDFRTILRKHNIARRENAFEVLVNLFLCKLVDEEENRGNLQFYWNGPASDNYFDFVEASRSCRRRRIFYGA